MEIINTTPVDGSIEDALLWLESQPVSEKLPFHRVVEKISFTETRCPYRYEIKKHIFTYLTDKVDILLSNSDSNINAEDDFGDSALHLAASKGSCIAIEILLAKGAYIDQQAGEKNSGFGPKSLRTALHFAIEYGNRTKNYKAADLLIRLGADTSIEDAFGKVAGYRFGEKYLTFKDLTA